VQKRGRNLIPAKATAGHRDVSSVIIIFIIISSSSSSSSSSSLWREISIQRRQVVLVTTP